MKELNLEQYESVGGGVLPLVVAIVVADVGLISAMIGSGLWSIEHLD